MNNYRNINRSISKINNDDRPGTSTSTFNYFGLEAPARITRVSFGDENQMLNLGQFVNKAFSQPISVTSYETMDNSTSMHGDPIKNTHRKIPGKRKKPRKPTAPRRRRRFSRRLKARSANGARRARISSRKRERNPSTHGSYIIGHISDRLLSLIESHDFEKIIKKLKHKGTLKIVST